jgi:hypothetical protein
LHSELVALNSRIAEINRNPEPLNREPGNGYELPRAKKAVREPVKFFFSKVETKGALKSFKKKCQNNQPTAGLGGFFNNYIRNRFNIVVIFIGK